MNHGLSALTLALLAALAGCGGGVSSSDEAERAYKGLDASIDKAIKLGFDGFNAASSANIDPQTAMGKNKGTMTVGGKVDQGSSDNKTMDLTDELKDYSDDGMLTYDTKGTLPTISLKLSKIPDGTLDGSMAGIFTMSGELEGEVTLDLTFAGGLQAGEGTKVERKPGTTHITGTAVSEFGTYDVDITR
jgi:hypothetical protein